MSSTQLGFMYYLIRITLFLACYINIHESRKCMPSPTVPEDELEDDDNAIDDLSKANNQRISSSSFRSEIVRRYPIRPSAAPVIPFKPLLLYGGGDPTDHIGAIVNPKVVLVFWGSQWSTTAGDPSGSANLLKNFFMNIGGSAWLNTVTEYCNGASYGSSTCTSISSTMLRNPPNILDLNSIWYDTTIDPPSTVDDTLIYNEAVKAARHYNHMAVGSNNNILYLIATPANVNMLGFGTSFCGFHSSDISPYGKIAYAFLPYTAGMVSCGANFNGLGPNAGVTVTASTTYLGWLTDPFPGYGAVPTGWYDPRYGEIGNKCSWIRNGYQGAVSAASSLNITETYPVQAIWSNKNGVCTNVV